MFNKIAPYFLFAVLFPSLMIAAPALPEVSTYDQLISAIREVRHASESRVEAAVEQEKVREAWETGKLIQEHILLNKDRAEYGAQVMKRLSEDIGIGYGELKYMREFARTYPKGLPEGQLSWSHYKALLAVNDEKERETVTKEASGKNWTRDQVREEVKKRNSPSPSKAASSSKGDRKSLNEVNSVRSTQSAVLDVKPGQVGMYRVVETTVGPNKGKLAVDLGFDNFYQIRIMGELRAGDIVKVGRDVKISPTDTTATRQKYRSERGFYHFTKVFPENLKGTVLLNAPKKPLYADESDLFTYEAYVSSVYDGDTFHCLIDLGFGLSTEQRVRLRQLDAPEILTGDGKDAKAALEKALMKDGGKVILKVSKSDDQYGRFRVDVFVKDKDITQELLKTGIFIERTGE